LSRARGAAWFRDGVVALMVLSLTACSTLRPIDDFSPSRIRAHVEVGDDVRIVARSGVAYELEVTAIGAAELEGRAASGKKYRIAFEAIQFIEVEEGDAIKTVAVSLASLYVVITVLFVLALRELGEDME
jgi:hypothetical protein